MRLVGAAMCAAALSTVGCDKKTACAETAHADGIGQACRNEGSNEMTADKLLEQMRPLDETKLRTLASSFTASARAPGWAAIELSARADEDASSNAKVLLLAMEETAIVPLVEAPNPADPAERMFLVRQSVEAELAMRRKVLTRLDKLLDDRSTVRVSSDARMEQRPPQRRVCDEAYLLMRKMVHLGEDPVDALVQTNMFLNAPDGFKDARIKAARASSIWNRAITGKDVVDYADSHPDSVQTLSPARTSPATKR